MQKEDFLMVYKCKICGGELDYSIGAVIATCQYCGTKQTLPRDENIGIIEEYNRINELRQNSEYDKAIRLCEHNLSSDSEDAENYWNMVLCRYGIDYVEDPQSHKHVPTINRMQLGSILKDKDYLKAIKYATDEQKSIYIKQATAIDKIQKHILNISKKEDPYDVFICYKEVDDKGERTQDSLIAEDLYNQLTREGFKVFFARITLEKRLGWEYEPYIFAALNSAKVMVVLGTKPEYLNAPWVKNEWSRYLGLSRDDPSKKLIPAYRNMDPYNLPGEFAHLQALDMANLGFVSDLFGVIRDTLKSKKRFSKKLLKVSASLITAASIISSFIFGYLFFSHNNDLTKKDINHTTVTDAGNTTLSENYNRKTFGDVLKGLGLLEKYTFNNDIFVVGGSSDNSETHSSDDTTVNLIPVAQEITSVKSINSFLSSFSQIDISKAQIISTDPSVASINSGMITANSCGQAIIYIIYEEQIDCLELNVVSIVIPNKFFKIYGIPWFESDHGDINQVIGIYNKIKYVFDDDLNIGAPVLSFYCELSYTERASAELRPTGYFRFTDPDGIPIRYFDYVLSENSDTQSCLLGYVLLEELSKPGEYKLEHIDYK